MSTSRERRRLKERERTRRRYADLLAWTNAFKSQAGCIDCGFSRWPEALHFDHIDPCTKRLELGWMDRSKVTTRSQAEAFKRHVQLYCEVRCANCHAHRSLVERHWRPASRSVDQPSLF